MKKTDYTSLNVEELKNKAAELATALEKMQLNHTIAPLENPMTIRHTRRDLAKVKTELNKKLTAAK